jgi:hypothetical protein
MPQTPYYYSTHQPYMQEYWATSAATTMTYVPVSVWQTGTTMTTMTTQTTVPVWTTWATNSTRCPDVWQRWLQQTPIYTYQPTYTPEILEEARVRIVREDEDRQAARTRARVLLGEFLDDQQKRDLERHGRFHVTGSRGRRYCIRTQGQAGNVDLLKPDGSVQARLCCHPRQGLPDGDAWLMQMIELRHDEQNFLRTANVHQGSLPADVFSGA